jgi:dienelactone hydrolase
MASTLLSVGIARSAEPEAPPKLSEQMRMPWQRGNTDYFRRWTLSDNLRCDLATACIPNEAAIVATEGGTSSDKDGKVVHWRRADSWGDQFGFGENTRDGEVAYAFRSIARETAGPVRLSIGTDNGVRVWVNGKQVLARDGQRKLTSDEDLVDVDLKAGDNQLLLKLAAKDFFTVRVLEAGATLRRSAEIAPGIVEMQSDSFIVRTDSTSARADRAEVAVDVLGPGGEIRFSGRGKRGERITVDARRWPVGPYETRFVTQNHLGLNYVTYRPWFKGNALDMARELKKSAATADTRTPQGATLQMLFEMVEDRLETQLASASGNPWPRIHAPLMEFAELMLEREGKPGRVRAGGFVRLAWIDDTDNTPQYCRAYLPWNYSAAKKWPTLLHLHGFNPANPKYIDWWGVDSRQAPYETEFSGNRSLIYIEPHGRGNTQYSGFGNADVRRCLAEAKRILSVDEDRVYLSGESMGGWGTWNVGTRNPELFAAIAPIFGGNDYRAEMQEENLARLSPVEHFLNERASSWAQADSLNNIPIFVDHGDADGAVKVEWSRWGVRLLQRWGYDVRYHEYPGKVHESLTASSNALIHAETMLNVKRNSHPHHVRIRSAELRNASAYWVRIEQRASPLEFMVADAELVDRNVIRLDTKNVVDVVITPGPLVDATKPVRVVWNGAARDMMASANGDLRLTDAAYASPKLHKNRALPGSLDDFFNTPFAVVVGTSSKDARINAICRTHAEQFSSQWEQWQKYRPRYFLDTEISDADIANYSLLLIGGPDANRVASRLAAQVPLRIRGDVITIGGQSYEAKNAGVQVLYPNPRNPQRYLWLTAGTSTSGLAFAAPNPYNLSAWDFIIDDGRVPAPKEQMMRERTRVVSGLFDQNWRFAPAFVQLGDVAVRRNGRQLRMPTGAVIEPQLAQQLAGTYQFSPGPRVLIEAKDGKLMLRAVDEAESAELHLIDALEFYAPLFNLWVWFERDATGRIATIKAYAGEDLEGKRVE